MVNAKKRLQIKRYLTVFFRVLGLVLLFMPCRVYADAIAKIIAKVNDRAITSQDARDYRIILEYQPPEVKDQLPKDEKELKKYILSHIVDDQLTIDAAKREREEAIKNEKDEKRKKSLEIPPEEIEKRIDEITAGYPSRVEFEKSLVDKGISLTILRERIKEQLLVRDAIDMHVRYNINISPQKIIDAYNANLKEMIAPLKYVFLLAKNADKNILTAIAAFLKENGEEKSIDKYKNELVKLESPANELKEGISGMLVKLKEGELAIQKIEGIDYLIYLSKIIPERVVPLEEAREKIANMLWQREYVEKLDAWLKELKENAVINILDDEYR